MKLQFGQSITTVPHSGHTPPTAIPTQSFITHPYITVTPPHTALPQLQSSLPLQPPPSNQTEGLGW